MNSWPRRLLLLGSGVAIGIGLVSLLQRFNPRNNPIPIPEANLPANWPQCTRVRVYLEPDNNGNTGVWLQNTSTHPIEEQVLVLWAMDTAQAKHWEQYPIINALGATDSIWIAVKAEESPRPTFTWHYRLQTDSCQGIVSGQAMTAR